MNPPQDVLTHFKVSRNPATKEVEEVKVCFDKPIDSLHFNAPTALAFAELLARMAGAREVVIR